MTHLNAQGVDFTLTLKPSGMVVLLAKVALAGDVCEIAVGSWPLDQLVAEARSYVELMERWQKDDVRRDQVSRLLDRELDRATAKRDAVDDETWKGL